MHHLYLVRHESLFSRSGWRQRGGRGQVIVLFGVWVPELSREGGVGSYTVAFVCRKGDLRLRLEVLSSEEHL